MSPADLNAAVSLKRGGAPRIGLERVTLLELIDELGSISAAAKQLGLSYKGAWDIVQALNNLFATPLVELPIDKVTPEEERDYGFFRNVYLGLWRRFFDPVGMRFSLDEKRVRVETYILPLIQNGEYNQLRDWTDAAQLVGIKRERIVLDPGFGFGKNFEENYPLLRRFDELGRTIQCVANVKPSGTRLIQDCTGRGAFLP